MPKQYYDKEELLKELEREVDLADDWYTAHEIENVVKYFLTVDEENIAIEYCMKRCLVMITMDTYEKLIAYYNRC